MVSGSMQTPTTTMRVPRGGGDHHLIEHAGHADALEDDGGTHRRPGIHGGSTGARLASR